MNLEKSTKGISAKKKESEYLISIHPNPFDDIIYIQTTNDIERIELFNMIGEIVIMKDNEIIEKEDINIESEEQESSIEIEEQIENIDLPKKRGRKPKMD